MATMKDEDLNFSNHIGCLTNLNGTVGPKIGDLKVVKNVLRRYNCESSSTSYEIFGVSGISMTGLMAEGLSKKNRDQIDIIAEYKVFEMVVVEPKIDSIGSYTQLVSKVTFGAKTIVKMVESVHNMRLKFDNLNKQIKNSHNGEYKVGVLNKTFIGVPYDNNEAEWMKNVEERPVMIGVELTPVVMIVGFKKDLVSSLMNDVNKSDFYYSGCADAIINKFYDLKAFWRNEHNMCTLLPKIMRDLLSQYNDIIDRSREGELRFDIYYLIGQSLGLMVLEQSSFRRSGLDELLAIKGQIIYYCKMSVCDKEDIKKQLRIILSPSIQRINLSVLESLAENKEFFLELMK